MSNKQVVEKFYEAFYGRDLGRLDEFLTPDFRGHAGAGPISNS